MSLNIEDRHLIDRYLQDDISGIELENFLLRLKSDEDLLRQVEFQRLIYTGVRKASHEKLKGVIISSIDYHKPIVPFALKMIVTFIAITLVGISLWFYVGNETANRDQSNSWFAFLKSKNKTDHPKESEEKINPPAKQKIVIPSDTSIVTKEKEPSPADSLETKSENVESISDSVPKSNDEENIVVKQDQLLISTSMAIEDKRDLGKEVDESLSKEAVEHLNPASDLPEKEVLPSSLTIEFWVSPINYRGYKMSKNKLVLFGIEEPDAIKLYRVNDGLYMSYLKEYYKLNDTFDFVAYQKLKEAEIPLAIR